MKKSIINISWVCISILTILLVAACGNPTIVTPSSTPTVSTTPTSTTPTPTVSTTPVPISVIAESWWGPYVRIDTGEQWYITGNSVRDVAGASYMASNASTTSITASGLTLELIAGTNGMVRVNKQGTVFCIYPKELRNSTFTGSIANVSTGASASNARGLTSLTNIKLLIRNKKNELDTSTVTTNNDGTFSVNKTVAGDEYEVTPVLTSQSPSSVTPPPVIVKALDPGSDVGTVSVTDTAYNFKATADYNNVVFYADGSTEWNLTVNITNCGSADSPSPIWTATSQSSGLSLSGTTSNNLQTIPSGASKSFQIKLKCAPITTAYIDVRIGLSLAVWNGPTWNDSITVRFNQNDRLTLNMTSEYSLRALILSPEGRLHEFDKMTNYGPNDYRGSIKIPRASNGYFLILAGANANSESKYALSIESPATKDWSTTLVSPGIGEPNDTPTQSTKLYINDFNGAQLGYLQPNDIDFLSFATDGLPAPTGCKISRVDRSNVNVSWLPVNGAEKYYVFVDNELQTVGGITTNSLNNVASTQRFAKAQIIAWSAAQGYSTATKDIELSMLPVVGGTFNNGTSNITVSSFQMSQFEISQSQYKDVMDSNPAERFKDGVNNPVYFVTWYDTLVFCNKLSISEGLTPVYAINGNTNPSNWGDVPTNATAIWNAVTMDRTANGYRLPTEAEWEFAARGGNSTHNYTYAGSNTIDDVAWYFYNSSRAAHAVGMKTANELGLYDMSGNIWEWCWDWSGSYSSEAQTDPIGVSTGSDRVLRGGSWNYINNSAMVTGKTIFPPHSTSNDFGFRVVRKYSAP